MLRPKIGWLVILLFIGVSIVLTIELAQAEGGNTRPPSGANIAYGTTDFFEGPGTVFARFDLDGPHDAALLAETGGSLGYPGLDFVGDEFDNVYAFSGNTLLSVNTTTGVETLIGAALPQTGETWSGMAWDRQGNTMYGTAHNSCMPIETSASSLYTIDLETGAATRIGAVSNGGCLQDIAIHPTTGIAYGINSTDDTFITIDKATGAGTVLAPLGFPVVSGTQHGMDFNDTTGTLYYYYYESTICCAPLRGYTVNLATGAPTLFYQNFDSISMDDFAIAAALPPTSVTLSTFDITPHTPSDVAWIVMGMVGAVGLLWIVKR